MKRWPNRLLVGLVLLFPVGMAAGWLTLPAAPEQAVADEVLRMPIPAPGLSGPLSPDQLLDKSDVPISEAMDAVSWKDRLSCDCPVAEVFRAEAKTTSMGITIDRAPALSFGEAPLAGAFGLVAVDLALPSGGTVDRLSPPAHVSVLTPSREVIVPSVPHVPVAVPDVATWLTMLLGFFGIGAALRVRKQKEVAACGFHENHGKKGAQYAVSQ